MQDQFQSTTEPAQEMMSIKDLCEPLYQAKGWIKLLGILMIISGVILALTCFGIIFAWLPIWLGIALMGSATAVERAYLNQQGQDLVVALIKLKTYFTVMGVMMLIGIILNISSFVFMLVTGALAGLMEAASSGMPQ